MATPADDPDSGPGDHDHDHDGGHDHDDPADAEQDAEAPRPDSGDSTPPSDRTERPSPAPGQTTSDPPSEDARPGDDEYDATEDEHSGRNVPDVDEGEGLFSHIVARHGAKKVLGGALRSGDVHVLLLGPPASGKSMMIESIDENVPGSIYRDGNRFTATRVQSTFQENPPLLLIDEMDAMDSDAYDVLSNPLEHGRVTEDTHNETYDQEVRTQLIATANTTQYIPDNIKSRFRIVEFGPYSKEEAVRVAKRMLPAEIDWIEDEKTAAKIAMAVQEETGSTDVREYRDVARLSGNLDEALEMARSVIDADAGVEPQPVRPEDVAVAQEEVSKEKMKEKVKQEQERHQQRQREQEADGRQTEAQINRELREEVVQRMAEKQHGGQPPDGEPP